MRPTRSCSVTNPLRSHVISHHRFLFFIHGRNSKIKCTLPFLALNTVFSWTFCTEQAKTAENSWLPLNSAWKRVKLMELSSSLGSLTFFLLLLLLFAPSKRAPLCFRKRWRFYFVVESPAQAIMGVHYHKIIIKRELLFSVWICTYVCLYVCICASLPPPLSSSPMSVFTWLQQPHGHIAHYFFSHSSPSPSFPRSFFLFSLSLRPYFSHIHHFSASVHFFFFSSQKEGST